MPFSDVIFFDFVWKERHLWVISVCFVVCVCVLMLDTCVEL